MTISLVTGGCGFIGSHIVDRLVGLGHKVIVIDDLSAPENEEFYFNEKAHYWEKDISKEDCESIFSGSCFEVNVIGTQRVLEWSRMHSVKKIIYSSTSSLYGHQNSIPFQPNMPSDCLNPYSMSKWMGEQICKLYNQMYDVSSVVLRYFNVYGPREPIKGEYAPVIGLFKRQKEAGTPMTIVGDGSQKRDFTYIDDVVDANICAMNSDIDHGIYNIGTGKNYTISEISRMIKGETVNIPSRPAEVYETLADISKTIRDLKWKPKYDLSDKINEY